MKIPRTSLLARNDGQSAMEALMALPFLIVVLLVGINFGKAFVLKQRAFAAARYAAWQSARTGQTSNETIMQIAGYAGDQMKVSYVAGGDSYGGSVTAISTLAETAANFLSRFYNCIQDPRATYQVSYKWSPLGRIFPDAELIGEHQVLLGDCRHKGGETTMRKIINFFRLDWILSAIWF